MRIDDEKIFGVFKDDCVAIDNCLRQCDGGIGAVGDLLNFEKSGLGRDIRARARFSGTKECLFKETAAGQSGSEHAE